MYALREGAETTLPTDRLITAHDDPLGPKIDSCTVQDVHYVEPDERTDTDSVSSFTMKTILT